MKTKVLKKSLSILFKFPARLWGISLLCAAVRLIICVAGIFVPIISIPLSLAISTGMSVIYLNGYNGMVPTSGQLFDGLKKENAARVIGGSCWRALWQLIWLFIPIANIVKALQYSFTPYILMRRPEISPTEALKVSMQETRGYKGKIFLTMIIVVVVEAVIVGVLSGLGVIPYIGVVAKALLGIFSALVHLFMPLLMGLIYAGFYDEAQKAKEAAEQIAE